MNTNFVQNFFIVLLLSIFLLSGKVEAGTLSCTVRTSACVGAELEVMDLSDTANAHAGNASSSYGNLVCCSGVSGLGISCAGTYATVLKLSSSTNAHARQGQLANYTGGTNICLSVPVNGEVSVGYQATDCSGYDTTLVSMVSTTNSHVGDAGTYSTYKVCASAMSGALSVDIVDAGGTSVSSPYIIMDPLAFSFSDRTVNGIFGSTDQKIRVENTTGGAQWTLSLAASGGATSYWDGSTADYDFNDPTAGATDGADADSLGGQMSIDPSVMTITPKSGCNNTGLSNGISSAFSQGVTDSITLITAGSLAGVNCYWDLTGINITQSVPKEQTPSNDYSINMTLTVTAV